MRLRHLAKERPFFYNWTMLKPRGAPLWGVFFITLLLSSCAAPGQAGGPASEYVLGTICTVNLFEKGKPELYSKIFGRLAELEDIFSANREGTDLGNVNRNAGQEPVKVREELIEVLEKALEYAEKSGGYFEPSIGPLVKLWGIGTETARVPGAEEIGNALTLINYRDIVINRAEGTVFLKQPGMALDLGGIAKGYAADEIVRLLSGEGIERGIIDLGGNIFAAGERRAGKKTSYEEGFWRIGIQDPRGNRGSYIGIVRVKNRSVVTSGVYERFFEEDGKRYHHIFSAKNGCPADNGLLSVTIIADLSIDADALSTAAFALGWEGGRELIAGIPGSDGIFVFEDLSLRLTPGLESDFTLTAAEYHFGS